jgi:hypothetical protein
MQSVLPSYVAGERLDLVTLLHREGLHFHSLAHNNYSTMMLVHHLMEEQVRYLPVCGVSVLYDLLAVALAFRR